MTEISVEVVQPTPTTVEVEVPGVGTIEVQLPPPIETITAVATGPRGPQGEQGEQGPPGPSGDDFVFEQDTPSDEWVVTHNLGRYPGGIQVIDSTGQLVGTEIVHDSPNQFRSLSDGAMTGFVTYT